MCKVCDDDNASACQQCKQRSSYDARVRLRSEGTLYVNWNGGTQSISEKASKVWRSTFVTGLG